MIEAAHERAIAGVPHELIRWTARRSDQIATCLAELEHEYVTAVDAIGEPKFLPVVSERARAKLERVAARKTRPPKKGKARSLAHAGRDCQSPLVRSKTGAGGAGAGERAERARSDRSRWSTWSASATSADAASFAVRAPGRRTGSPARSRSRNSGTSMLSPSGSTTSATNDSPMFSLPKSASSSSP